MDVLILSVVLLLNVGLESLLRSRLRSVVNAVKPAVWYVKDCYHNIWGPVC